MGGEREGRGGGGERGQNVVQHRLHGMVYIRTYYSSHTRDLQSG